MSAWRCSECRVIGSGLVQCASPGCDQWLHEDCARDVMADGLVVPYCVTCWIELPEDDVTRAR